MQSELFEECREPTGHAQIPGDVMRFTHMPCLHATVYPYGATHTQKHTHIYVQYKLKTVFVAKI